MAIRRMISFEYYQPEAGFLIGGGVSWHWALTYGISGQLHAVVDGYDLIVNPGELVLCPPERFSMLYAQEGQAPTYLSAAFEAETGALLPLAGKVLPSEALAPMFALMVAEAQCPSSSFALKEHLLSAVVLLLARQAAGLPVPQSALRPQHGENTIIRRAQQYISNHLREKLSVTLVANRIDVSPSYMTALFHKHLGISPGEYIRRAKLQESKLLMQEGTLNFTEIAAALEYSTVHHFSRQFKEHFGITPTQYAKGVAAKGV
jgi:AraC-like DNA-binding protein